MIMDETKKALVLSLKEVIHKLTPYAHEAKEGCLIDERNPHAAKLMSILERCLLHGMKLQQFYGVVPFWGLLERLESASPPCVSIRNSVGAVACMSTLRTPLAKARGWIRQVTNTALLVDCLQEMMQHVKFIHFFYDETSLFYNSEHANILLAVLRSLNIFHFNFRVEDESLNLPLSWLPTQTPRPAPKVAPQPNPTSGSANTRSSSGMLFDSFFSTLEKGLDSVIAHVDVATTSAVRYLNETLVEDVSSVPTATSSRLFGTSLQVLVVDDTRCRQALYDSRLSVPDQLIHMITALSSGANTPSLFRKPVLQADVLKLRRSLEAEQGHCTSPIASSPLTLLGIPPELDVQVVAHVFLQYLYELPEPLLGYDLYSALQSCAEIENKEHRIRNMSLLMDEVPAYNLPTLLQVISLLHTLTRPRYANKNGLNLIAVGVFSTPFLLRPSTMSRIAGAGVSSEASDKAHLALAAAGGAIVEMLIEHTSIFDTVRQRLQMLEKTLNTKCQRITTWQEDYCARLTKENECFDLLLPLWKAVENVNMAIVLRSRSGDEMDEAKPTPASNTEAVFTLESEEDGEQETKKDSTDEKETLDSKSEDKRAPPPNMTPRTPSNEDEPVPSTLTELLQSSRWSGGCFTSTDSVHISILRQFDADVGGKVAIKCLTHFMENYCEKAAALASELISHKHSLCSLPQVTLSVTKLVVSALRLVMWTKNGTVPTATHMPVLARQLPAWTLLSDENSLMDLFTIAMLTFGDLWKHLSQHREKAPVNANEETVEFYTQCVRGVAILLEELGPVNVDELWVMWTEQRVRRQEQLVEEKLIRHHKPAPATPVPSKQPTSVPSGTVTSAELRKLLPHHTATTDASKCVIVRETSSIYRKKFLGSSSCVMGESVFITAKHIQFIEENLPPALQCHDWKLKFKLSRDGSSILSLLRLSESCSTMLLFVRDDKDGIFGALIPEKFQKLGDKYYGDGGVKVFSFVVDPNGKIYSTSLKNNYYLMTSDDAIAVGGGGDFALYLDSELHHGSSGECETFNSPCLASSTSFICTGCVLFSLEPAPY